MTEQQQQQTVNLPFVQILTREDEDTLKFILVHVQTGNYVDTSSYEYEGVPKVVQKNNAPEESA